MQKRVTDALELNKRKRFWTTIPTITCKLPKEPTAIY